MMKKYMTHEEVLQLLKDGYDKPRGWTGDSQPHWHQVVHRMWRHMWLRCYDPTHPRYMHYKDSIIYDDFEIFSNYVDFIKSQPSFEEFKATCHEVRWSMDKDMKVLGNKNYFPEFMTLCTSSENSRFRNLTYDYTTMNTSFNNPETQAKCRQSKLKPVIGISTENKHFILLKYIRESTDYGFDFSTVRKCCSGCYHHKHKKYKWYYLNYKHNRKYRLREGDTIAF